MIDRAVIFDCDGVLVDSERVAAQVLAELAAELSVRLPTTDVLEFIRGRKVDNWLAELEDGSPLPPTFLADWRVRCDTAFDRGLEPIAGVQQVFGELTEPYCCASSSPREKIEHVLSCTGLLEQFHGRIHSAYEVGSWKPDPGVFVAAAATLNVRLSHCAVIEDSILGVQAGVAAGMTVFGYVGDAPVAHADSLREHGAIPFRSMAKLPALLQKWRDGLTESAPIPAHREQEMRGCP